MKLFVFFFSAFVLVHSGPIEETFEAGRILGKNDATPHLVPWQAFLKLETGHRVSLCGGSLISNKYILTAGHCAEGRTSGSVLLGAFNRTSKEEPDQRLVRIKRFIPHPQFDRNSGKGYDIGLLEMEVSVQENDAIKIGTLPTYADVGKTYEGETGRVSGWGLISSEDNTHTVLPDVLQYYEETIISNQQCARIYRNVPESDVCLTGRRGDRTCQGDSGGPMTVEGVIVGVNSFGAPHCSKGPPSVFTRTTAYLDWIQENSDVTIKQ